MPQPECPICKLKINADESAFAHHVEAHFEGSVLHSTTSDHGHSDADDEVYWEDESGELVAAYGGGLPSSSGVEVLSCPVCNLAWSFMSSAVKEDHVASHFADPEIASSRSSPTNRAKGPSAPSKVKPHARDIVWTTSATSEAPKNITPGVIPFLRDMLERSVMTRSAVLCDASILYIHSIPLLDLHWGCGYRNFQMAYSTIRPFLSPPLDAPPRLFDLQVWIEDAWAAGYDAIGRDQLGGKLRGKSKWIGTADIWVACNFQGIRCKLIDFPEMSQKNNSHSLLIRWVTDYFKPEESGAQDNVFDNLMATRGATVQMSRRLPLILQHQGHSRTIVGVETLRNGETNLLVFDPGKTLPTQLRTDAVSSFSPLSSASSSDAEDVTIIKEKLKRPPTSSKNKGSKRKKLKAMLSGGDGSSLKIFRVSMNLLKRNAAYQILAFERPADFDEPVMGGAERLTKRVVVADRIVK